MLRRPAHVGLWLAGLIWVLPPLNFYHNYPITSFFSEWISACLGLAALTLLLQGRLWRDLALPRIALVPLGLAGLLVLQLLLGKVAFAEQAFLGCLYLLWAAFLMVLGSVLRREAGWEGAATVLAWCALAGGLLSALVAILQHYQIHTLLDPWIAAQRGAQVSANTAQPNHFADYTAQALASLLFLAARRRLSLVLALPAGALLLFVLALSGSRSAWLYLAALAVLSLWYSRRQGDGRGLAIGALVLLPGFVLAQYLIHLPWLAGPVVAISPTERLFQPASGLGSRLVLWREAWHMFLQAPLTGVGFGQFAWHRFLLSGTLPDPYQEGLANNAHNLLLQLLAEFGLPAALLVAGGLLLWAMGAARERLSLARWWMLSLLAVLGIHSMLEYPLWYTDFLGIAAILLGMGEARLLPLKLGRLGRGAFAAALVLGWLSALNLLHSYGTMERLLHKRYHYASEGQAAQRGIQSLLDIRRDSLLAPYIDLVFTGAITLDKDHLADKLGLNGGVMRFAPTAEVAYRQAMLLALNGEGGAAMGQLRLAAAAYPRGLKDAAAALERLQRQYGAPFAPLAGYAETKLKEREIAVRSE